MMDRELFRQALEALEKIAAYRPLTFAECSDAEAVMGIAENAIPALRERLAQPEPEPANYKELLNKSEARLHEVAVHCERVERRLKEVNTAAMNLTHDLVCMDYDDDDRLNRDRVMGRIMQWRNEWDKAMHIHQQQMHPCAGRNCGSTNPNLHSAECFEDYEESTGLAQPEQKTCLVANESCKHGSWCSEVYCQEHCKFVEQPAQPEQKPMKHGGRPMTLRECMEAEEPEQPEHEPVAWVGPSWLHPETRTWESECFAPGPIEGWIPLYSAPRQWQGLTDEEIERACAPLGAAMLSFTEVARAIEAKLRQKNA